MKIKHIAGISIIVCICLAVGIYFIVNNKKKENLHVIAVYEAQNGNTESHKEGDIGVYVDIPNTPVSLLLSSYEPVIWKIKKDPKTRIEKIYLNSYYDSKVEGTNAPIEIVKKINGDNILLDEHTHHNIKEKLNKEAKTYQYEYSGIFFRVDGEIGNDYAEFKQHSSKSKNIPVLFTNNTLKATYNIYKALPFFYTNKYVTKGKYYFEAELELEPNADVAYSNIGIMSNQGHYFCEFNYPQEEGECYYAALDNKDIRSLKSNDIVGVAFDMDKGEFRYSINGVWSENVIKFRNDGRDYCPAVEVNEGVTWIANFGATEFRYKKPKGYKAFDS